MKHCFAFLVITVLCLCSCQKGPQKMVCQGLTQGSYYAITYFDDSGRDFQQAFDSIFDLVDGSVSLWNDTSIICRVNRNEPVTLNQVFIDNFNIAQEAARLSDGYFDPTISPLVQAWGFSAKEGTEITPVFVDSLKSLVDYRKVHLEMVDSVGCVVMKDDPRITLDFNAIAQGYTSDMIGFYLESQGVTSYLVDTGGEIMARGTKPHGKPWRVGIEKPADNWDSERSIQELIEVVDKGVVTSGNYRKYVERDGKRYSHCIDPKTGYPVNHNLLSATVITHNSVWADALASICMSMGMERAEELLSTLDDVEAFFIYVDDKGDLGIRHWESDNNLN